MFNVNLFKTNITLLYLCECDDVNLLATVNWIYYSALDFSDELSRYVKEHSVVWKYLFLPHSTLLTLCKKLLIEFYAKYLLIDFYCKSKWLYLIVVFIHTAISNIHGKDRTVSVNILCTCAVWLKYDEYTFYVILESNFIVQLAWVL